MEKSAVIIFLMLISIVLTACSYKTDNEAQIIATAAQEVSKTVYENEENKVLEVYEKVQQAMIDKDIDTLDRIIKDGTTFTHVSGKTQTKEEYFVEIADGTLNYYKYKIDNCHITVNGDKATLKADVTLTAKVYGISGSWTLRVNPHFEKINGEWIYCN
ncbi:MAG: nuclear transport factor 2 family protein [Clostridiales bacterium]|nr:nuclear transport factor 2 family protein [Clostridiales bacterium]